MNSQSIDSLQYVLDHLDPDRIRLARERLGMTGKALADLIQKTPSAVSQFESGAAKPDYGTLARLALALRVPSGFFVGRRRAVSVTLDDCHFRARRSVSQMTRRVSVSSGRLLLELVLLLEERGVVFPKEQISSFVQRRPKSSLRSAEEIEGLALELRRHWGLGVGPIPNLVQLLESKGVFVLPLEDTHADVDAYSCWAAGRPCVMLALNKTASRARFDAAHELAHLVVHDDAEPGDHDIEREADRFASAFLAPREGFLHECPRRWNLEAFLQLKPRWRMSVAALVRRAYDLGALSHSSYTRAFQDLTMQGMRRDEPGEWTMEQPTLLSQAVEVLRGVVDVRGLGEQMSLHPGELRSLLERNLSPAALDALAPRADKPAAPVVRFSRQP